MMLTITKLSTREASVLLGIHPQTLRRWEREGRVTPELTPGKHRRYDVADLRRCMGHNDPRPDNHVTLAYARVSSYDQKDDLERQAHVLESFCAAHGWAHEVIRDLGSGLNYEKKGLKLLLKRICSGEVTRLVITHKDRLLRFGSEIVFALCEHFGTQVVIINLKGDSSYEEDLAHDVLEIITVFSARLYGARSHKNKKTMDVLRDAADAIQKS